MILLDLYRDYYNLDLIELSSINKVGLVKVLGEEKTLSYSKRMTTVPSL